MTTTTRTAESKLHDRLNNPDYLALSGSRLYGTNREDSDTDLRGFTLPPVEYLLGVKEFGCAELAPHDHKIYSLKYFIGLVLHGDPQCTEMLFVPPQFIQKMSTDARNVLDKKKDFLSNNIYRRLAGYSYSEWRKATGVKYLVGERTITEDSVINDIRNIFHPDKEEMDEVINMLMAKHERTLVPSINNLGAKRKAEFEKFGWGVSSGTHAIRLLDQAEELMRTAHLTFPRPNAQVLREIRSGVLDQKAATQVYEEARRKLDETKTKSILPDKPNSQGIWKLYQDIAQKFIASEGIKFKEQ